MNGRLQCAPSPFPLEIAVPTTLLQSHLPGLDLVHRGKVRDVYALSAQELLIVASDRLSAFDVILPDPIPGKGEMLCQISNFWFAKTAHLVPNHLRDPARSDPRQGRDAVPDLELLVRQDRAPGTQPSA